VHLCGDTRVACLCTPQYGLAAICNGGGGASALVVEAGPDLISRFGPAPPPAQQPRRLSNSPPAQTSHL
jgi:hypothetical protein